MNGGYCRITCSLVSVYSLSRCPLVSLQAYRQKDFPFLFVYHTTWFKQNHKVVEINRQYISLILSLWIKCLQMTHSTKFKVSLANACVRNSGYARVKIGNTS